MRKCLLVAIMLTHLSLMAKEPQEPPWVFFQFGAAFSKLSNGPTVGVGLRSVAKNTENPFGLQFSMNYTNLGTEFKGKRYSSNLISIDLLLVASARKEKGINPFIGLGAVANGNLVAGTKFNSKNISVRPKAEIGVGTSKIMLKVGASLLTPDDLSYTLYTVSIVLSPFNFKNKANITKS